MGRTIQTNAFRELELLINTYGIADVLLAMSDVCHAKSEAVWYQAAAGRMPASVLSRRRNIRQSNSCREGRTMASFEELQAKFTRGRYYGTGVEGKRKRLVLQVVVTVPADMPAKLARREVRTLINNQSNYSTWVDQGDVKAIGVRPYTGRKSYD